ncbi:uncharacterized protein LOC144431919 isoform X2 [Styela clava]
MRGFRTRPVAYPRGAATASGKQTAYLRSPKEQHRPHLLLLSDSNIRNITFPKVVSPSPSSPFSLSSICLPGGQLRHGVAEILGTEAFPEVDYLLLALGTNDVAGSGGWGKQSREYAEKLIGASQQAYPGVKILLAKILPQSNCSTAAANRDMDAIGKLRSLRLLDLDVGSNPSYWSDDLHQSDRGLARYMQILESVVARIVRKGEMFMMSLFFILYLYSKL